MKVYAYKHALDILKRSSSGGAFTKIVEVFAGEHKDNISIYGAAWTDNNEVKHIRVSGGENIKCLNGSKYVRSNIKGIYIEVEKDLLNGKAVLFSGTPCQVFGLMEYIKRKKISDEKLLTIDVICHGTPKPLILKEYINWLEEKYKSQIIDMTFRDKSVGWKRYPTKIVFENGKILCKSYDAQLYIRMYFSLLILEEKCYSCKFSNMNRVADITLGDFWGVNEIMPEINSGQGVSLVIVNSEKGQTIIDKAKEEKKDSEVLIRYQGEEFLKYQHNLNRPTEMPKQYEKFWDDYKQNGFNYVVKKYKFDTLKGKIKFTLKMMLVQLDYFNKRLS